MKVLGIAIERLRPQKNLKIAYEMSDDEQEKHSTRHRDHDLTRYRRLRNTDFPALPAKPQSNDYFIEKTNDGQGWPTAHRTASPSVMLRGIDVSAGSLGKTAKLALGRAKTVAVLPYPGALDVNATSVAMPDFEAVWCAESPGRRNHILAVLRRRDCPRRGLSLQAIKTACELTTGNRSNLC